jgi:4-hydroxybenzoate polyprenyltransferase
MAKTGGEVYWSFYILSSLSEIPRYFFTFFGNLPSGIVYFGTKIVFALAIFFFSALVFLITRDYLKTLLAFIGSYVILFFMGIFPDIVYFIYQIPSGLNGILASYDFNIAQFFATGRKILGLSTQSIAYAFPRNLDFIYFPLFIFFLSILFYSINKNKFFAVLKNARYPQLVTHSGLFFIGAGLGYLSYPQNFSLNIFSLLAGFILLISIWLAWLASVIVNDIYDFGIDGISNADRPLQKKVFTPDEYRQLGIIFFLLSLIGALTVGFHFVVLLLVYQIIAWFYSAEPFRFKKFPGAATFMSALALMAVLFSGFILMSDKQTISGLSFRIIFLFLIAYTISLPIKDMKDIEGDKAYGIWTVPVIFSEKTARYIIAVSLFISYAISVFFLNELRLFWWAMLFGTLTFFTVISKKIKPDKIFWPVLGLIAIYGLILVKIVFL